jgi:hypothetical protein
MSNYTFQWGTKACSGKRDPRHTISGIDQELAAEIIDHGITETWRRDMRAGTPWQLLNEHGVLLKEGVR